MGWSCSDSANKVVDKWSSMCRESSGSSNTWSEGGNKFFFEISRREYNDGAITGSIMKMVPGSEKPDGSFLATKSGSFKINGDGTVARGPAFLKRFVTL